MSSGLVENGILGAPGPRPYDPATLARAAVETCTHVLVVANQRGVAEKPNGACAPCVESAIRAGQRTALEIPELEMGDIVHQAVIVDHIREGRGGRGIGENAMAGQAILAALRARVGVTL